ncbi:hypothetical protein DVH24_004639 [Malus domestica]|uniref:RNase H type-1 domain-containing protein n=1 Tax=Malus domestica TaxID=3750 RepID=A0A498IF22_MALDO|nr:hypothetical protein DVH24_004639 [Malus domestica]
MSLTMTWDERCGDVIIEWDSCAIEVTHIYREKNVSADHIADLGHDVSLSLQVLFLLLPLLLIF